tara:strand:- start:84284 stop:85036 length:753 start_codon:yes stop_codon:yes gene_type:complete
MSFNHLFSQQNDTLKLHEKFNHITADELNNIYIWNDENLKKYDFINRQQFIYNNISLGSIYQIDAYNPMKILVFHADFNTIITLDNTLTQNGSEINLSDYDLDNTSLICRSYNNGIWCFDPVLFKLIRFDNTMQLTNEVEYIQNIIENYDSIFFMTENNDFLYLQSPSEVYVFDKFGSYLKRLPIASEYKIAVFESGIFFIKNQALYFYSFKNIDIQKVSVEIPFKPTDFAIANKMLYLLTDKYIIKKKL